MSRSTVWLRLSSLAAVGIVIGGLTLLGVALVIPHHAPTATPVALYTAARPRLQVTPLVGASGQTATATITGLRTPANPAWRWARLTVEAPDGSLPVDSLWAVPTVPVTRTWRLTGDGAAVITLCLFTHDTASPDWCTEYLLDTHEGTFVR